MRRLFGASPSPSASPLLAPSYQMSSGEKEEEDHLVRQLVEALDVDEVIERMEMEHYHHLAPIVRSLASFDHEPQREERRFHATGQQQPHRKEGGERRRKFDGPLNAPFRSPTDERAKHGNKERELAGESAQSLLRSAVVLSPPISARDHRSKPTGELDAPPLSSSSNMSDMQTSSAPLDNDHTEKPSLHRTPRRSRGRRRSRLRPPVDSTPSVDMPQLSRLDDKYDDDKIAFATVQQQQQQHRRQQQYRRHSGNWRAPSPGEIHRHSVSRQLELNRSYRELSGLRAPSSDMYQRKAQCAEHHQFSRAQGGGASTNIIFSAPTTRRALTPPPPEVFSARQRSSSPPIVPPWSLLSNDAAAYYANTGYWGRMDNGFECTPTATTEEAHTPDDPDFDEEEDGSYVAVPPRIIEREQHRRRRVVDSLPSPSHAAVDSPRGRATAGDEKVVLPASQEAVVEAKKTDEGKGDDASCHPLLHTNTVTAKYQVHKNKESVTKRGNSDVFDSGFSRDNLSASSLVSASQDHVRSGAKENAHTSENPPYAQSSSQMMSGSPPSTIQTAKEDIPSGRQNSHRISPALSPNRLQNVAPITSSSSFSKNAKDNQQYCSNGKTRSNMKMKDNVVKPGKLDKHIVTGEEHGVRKAGNAKRPIAPPSLSLTNSSSYSYSYTSYTSSTDLAAGVQSPKRVSGRAVAADGKGRASKALPGKNGWRASGVGPKILPPQDMSVYPPLATGHGGKNVNSSSLVLNGALQRKQRKEPPPPSNSTATFQKLYASPALSHVNAHYNGQQKEGPPRVAGPGGEKLSFGTKPAAVSSSGALYPVPSASTASNPVKMTTSYVSYLPSSLIPPPTGAGSVKRGENVSLASSDVNMNGKVQELVWRTGGSGSVGASDYKDNPASKSRQTSRSASIVQRSASAEVNSSPPKNIPLRAQHSSHKNPNSILVHTTGISSPRTSRHSLPSTSSKPYVSRAVRVEEPHASQQPQGHPVSIPTFAIQLPHQANKSNPPLPFSSALRIHLVQNR